MENNSSGKGKEAEVPAEIQGWSWGAFLMSWIWGIGNNTYRAFWVFFPLVNFVMAIALGLKGNEWAWRHKQWKSIEHFKRVQRRWAQAGIVLVFVSIVFAVAMIFGINSMFKKSEPFIMAHNIVKNSPEVLSTIGSPIETGFVTGNMTTSGPDGTANLFYGITGPLSAGSVAVKATRQMGSWFVECLIVYYENSNPSTVLLPCESGA